MGCNCNKKGNAGENTSASRKRSNTAFGIKKCPQCGKGMKKVVGYLRCYSCGHNERVFRG